MLPLSEDEKRMDHVGTDAFVRRPGQDPCLRKLMHYRQKTPNLAQTPRELWGTRGSVYLSNFSAFEISLTAGAPLLPGFGRRGAFCMKYPISQINIENVRFAHPNLLRLK